MAGAIDGLVVHSTGAGGLLSGNEWRCRPLVVFALLDGVLEHTYL